MVQEAADHVVAPGNATGAVTQWAMTCDALAQP